VNWRPAPWRKLFSRRSAKIFLVAWVFATLALTTALVVSSLIFRWSYVGIEPAMFGILFVLSTLFYAIPALFVGLCVVLVTAWSVDIRKSENTILGTVSVVYGIALGIPNSGNLIAIAIGAVIGFISAVIALIMTKDLRIASHVHEPAR
jgi:phosphotransferase system  glucose/maltose/N-acetylglucosamine-specific IIC component